MEVRRVLVTVVICLLCGSAFLGTVAPLADAHDSQSEGYEVIVQESGDATVRLVQVYDLTNTTEQATFTKLRENISARETRRDRFVSRIREQAQTASEITGRSMEVESSPVSVSTSDDEDHGIVTFTCTWSGFATTSGNETMTRLESEALDGFTARNYSVTVTPPTAYTYESASPEPSSVLNNEPMWDAGSTLNNFHVAFTTTHDENESSGFFDSLVVQVSIVVLIVVVTAYFIAKPRRYP